MDDPEIVGEFVQCLKILRVTKAEDPECYRLVEQGIAYLVHAEHKRKRQGTWVPAAESLYSRYHASYCGAIALIDHSYNADEFRDHLPPISRALRCPVWTT